LIDSGQSGLLVPSGDVPALANGITQVLDDAAVARMWGQNGRVQVFPALDISRLVKDIDALYTALIKEKGLVI
jgi:glycosyltransferase involved in cell wall biosynthesis